MFVVILLFELHIPQSRSLKEKRKVVRGLIDRMQNRFNISVAEVDWHDLHQRSRIGVAAVRRSPSEADDLCDRLRRLVESEQRAIIVAWSPEIVKAEP